MCLDLYDERKADTLNQAAVLADDYILTHKLHIVKAVPKIISRPILIHPAPTHTS